MLVSSAWSAWVLWMWKMQEQGCWHHAITFSTQLVFKDGCWWRWSAQLVERFCLQNDLRFDGLCLCTPIMLLWNMEHMENGVNSYALWEVSQMCRGNAIHSPRMLLLTEMKGVQFYSKICKASFTMHRNWTFHRRQAFSLNAQTNGNLHVKTPCVRESLLVILLEAKIQGWLHVNLKHWTQSEALNGASRSRWYAMYGGLNFKTDVLPSIIVLR